MDYYIDWYVSSSTSRYIVTIVRQCKRFFVIVVLDGPLINFNLEKDLSPRQLLVMKEKYEYIPDAILTFENDFAR